MAETTGSSALPSDKRLRDAAALRAEQRQLERQASALRVDNQRLEAARLNSYQKATEAEKEATYLHENVKAAEEGLNTVKAQIAEKEHQARDLEAKDPAGAATLRREADRLRPDLAIQEQRFESMTSQASAADAEHTRLGAIYESAKAEANQSWDHIKELDKMADSRASAANGLETQVSSEPHPGNTFGSTEMEQMRGALRDGHQVSIGADGQIKLSPETSQPMDDKAADFVQTKLVEMQQRVGAGYTFNVRPDGTITGGGPGHAEYVAAPGGKLTDLDMQQVRGALARGQQMSVAPDGTIVTSDPATPISSDQAAKNVQVFDHEVQSGTLNEKLATGQSFELTPDGQTTYQPPEPLATPLAPNQQPGSPPNVTSPPSSDVTPGDQTPATPATPAPSPTNQTPAAPPSSQTAPATPPSAQTPAAAAADNAKDALKPYSSDATRGMVAQYQLAEQQRGELEAKAAAAQAESKDLASQAQQAQGDQQQDLLRRSQAAADEASRFTKQATNADNQAGAYLAAVDTRNESDRLLKDSQSLTAQSDEVLHRFQDTTTKQEEAFRQWRASEATATALKGNLDIIQEKVTTITNYLQSSDATKNPVIANELRQELTFRQNDAQNLQGQLDKANQDASQFKQDSDKLQQDAVAQKDQAIKLMKQAQDQANQAQKQQSLADKQYANGNRWQPDATVLKEAGVAATTQEAGIVVPPASDPGIQPTTPTAPATQPPSPAAPGTQPSSSTEPGTQPTSSTEPGTQPSSSTDPGTQPTSQASPAATAPDAAAQAAGAAADAGAAQDAGAIARDPSALDEASTATAMAAAPSNGGVQVTATADAQPAGGSEPAAAQPSGDAQPAASVASDPSAGLDDLNATSSPGGAAQPAADTPQVADVTPQPEPQASQPLDPTPAAADTPVATNDQSAGAPPPAETADASVAASPPDSAAPASDTQSEPVSVAATPDPQPASDSTSDGSYSG